jgi:aminoglycoside N3'-acetyltransferase
LADDVLGVCVEAVGPRSLLFPAFADGYRDGVCDLDRAPSSTGVLSERFLTRPGVVRTLSAFFSFGVGGPAAAEVADLLPADAWGDGSLYGWMEERNVRFVLLGTHPTHCSYLHRLEWLGRDHVRYRYPKTFAGQLVRNGRATACTETLYVRRLDPPAVNDFTVLTPLLAEAGMRAVRVRGVSVAGYSARPVRDAVLPALRRDPWLVVANRSDYEGAA